MEFNRLTLEAVDFLPRPRRRQGLTPAQWGAGLSFVNAVLR
jgi:hypothetical protein